ncbi:hypothetical protein FRC04_002162 [Tulasnella sp. 424]|nr:hypothetical protein FRC04_002162 [Tulasnella sp. 424]KAG8967804.1 hypothetical protein FRC05_001900 [Tulasnella sp. 425]
MAFNPLGAVEAVILNNQAVLLSKTGDDGDSEHLHRKALELKIANFGSDSITTAISYNALGEALLSKEKDARGPAFDAAVSRENLARVYEAQGKWVQAKELRTRRTEEMVCSNYQVNNFAKPIRGQPDGPYIAVPGDHLLDGRAEKM